VSVGAVLARLREGGEAVAEGRLRVDAARALAKLRDFRLADPHHYVLELLRCAAACGAARVEVRYDADELEIAFDGRPLGDLPELFAAVLSGSGDPARAPLRLLAFGVLGALALRPRWVHVESAGLAFDVRPPDLLEPARAREPTRTRVHVQKRRGLAALKAALLGAPEAATILTSVAQYEPELLLNGEPAPRFALPELAFRRERRRGALRVAGGVPRSWLGRRPTLPGSSHVEIALHGALVVQRHLTLPLLQLEARANHDALRRNASGSDVVLADATWRELEEALGELADGLLGDLVGALSSDRADEVRPLLIALAARANAGERGIPGSLLGAPLLPGPAGEWVSVGALRTAAAKGKLRVSHGAQPAGFYDTPAIRLDVLDAGQRELVPEAQLVDIADTVRERQRRAGNRRAWETQPVEAARVPASVDAVLRTPIEDGELRGEVALLSGGSEPSVRFLHQGRLVEQREVPELRPLRLAAVVDGEALRPDVTWQELTRDSARRAVEAVRRSATQALANALAAGNPGPALLAHGRDVARLLMERRQELPASLRQAPLYELAGGGRASLDELLPRQSVRCALRAGPHPALDGEPVVVLSPEERIAWRQKLGQRRVVDFDEALRREAELREQRSGPPRPARLAASEVLVRVPLRDLDGELGVPAQGGSELRLLARGAPLPAGSARPPLPPPCLAIVDTPDLQPTPAWDGVLPGPALKAALGAISEAGPRLLEALLARFADLTLEQWPGPARQHLTGWLSAEFAKGRPPSPARPALLAAPLVLTPRGRASLGELLEATARERRLWAVEPDEQPRLPEGLLVVRASRETVRLLARIAGVKVERPDAAIERERGRAEFDRQPRRQPVLAGALLLRVPLPPFRGELGLPRDPGGRKVEVEVLLRGRPFAFLAVEVPRGLQAVVDLDDPDLDPLDRRLPERITTPLREAVLAAARAATLLALEQPEQPAARLLLLDALVRGLDGELPALASARLLPTLGGGEIAITQLPETVLYVTEPIDGAAPPGDPVLLAAEPEVRLLVERFKKRRRNVTEDLRERAVEAPAPRLQVPGDVLWRGALEGLTGEVALLAEPEPARLDLFHEGESLRSERFPAPAGVAAVAVVEGVRRKRRGGAGVPAAERNRVVAAVLHGLLALADDVAARFPTLGAKQQRALGPALVRLCGFLVQRERRDHPLLALPLLAASDDSARSFRELLAQAPVAFSDADGQLLDGRAPWRPRSGEREVALSAGLRLLDVSAAVRRAAEIRQRGAVRSLAVEGRWREAVRAPGIEGEVALPEDRPGSLRLELHRDRLPLETVVLEHPIGGHARVDAAALQPDELWMKAARDAAFQAVRQAVDAALERALARLLREGSRRQWRELAGPALRWQFQAGGPAAQALLQLPLFRDAAGAEVSLGRVLAEAAERGQVAIVEAGTRDILPGRLVLAVDTEARDWLQRLKVKVEDLAVELRRARERAEKLEKRRLRSITFEGTALLRLPVDEAGLRGELALPLRFDRNAAVVLARQGIAVDSYRSGELGVAGVLDHPDLPASPEWDAAQLDARWRARLDELLERLFARLAAEAPGLTLDEAQLAIGYALRRLARAGVTAVEHLDRIGGAADALARAPFFEEVSGRRVSLRAVADHLARGGSLALLPAGPPASDEGPRLSLRAQPVDAPWTSALEALLGRGSIARFESAEAWAQERAERDPPPDDPLARGLLALRRETALLRADVLARLSPGHLKEIRLDRGATVPIRYDAVRHVGLLDAGHPVLAAALAAAAEHSEPRHLLLAALCGAVNRELEEVTDADEARMAAALLSHLASGTTG
jgi:hypothetical protein